MTTEPTEQAAPDDTDPEIMYPLLAALSEEDWQDASSYGLGPIPP